MRVQLTISPVEDCSIPYEFEYKFRGVLYSYLDNSIAEDIHNSDLSHFVFSGVFPYEDVLSEGVNKNIIISSHRSDIINSLAKNINNELIEVGDIVFKVEDVDVFNQEIPINGTLYTPSGVYCVVESEYDTPSYWKEEEYGTNEFINVIEEQLDEYVDEFTDYNSDNRDFSVFNRLEFDKQFARKIRIDTNESHTVVLTKWNLSYTVMNDLHYEYIKLAYSLGIGGKNSIGMGYCFLK